MTDVYMNSRFVGTVDDPVLFVEDVKDLRRKGSLPEDVNIRVDEATNEISIYTDEGRARRPLIIVKEGKPLLTEKHLQQLTDNEITWLDLVRQGVIEYLDAGEEENALVAYDENDLTPDYTHLEITPGAISGITTALVPFANQAPSSRIIIGSKNQKQALGFTHLTILSEWTWTLTYYTIHNIQLLEQKFTISLVMKTILLDKTWL